MSKDFERAKKLFPGGVNSPVRAFKAVGGDPFFVEKGKGAYLYDTAGNSYIDFVCSWGPLVLGHADPDVISALSEQLNKGTSYGACSRLESELAELIIKSIPSIEKIRFVNSGTEAALSVVRLARAYTQKTKIIKFEGCYHGHVDALLAEAGSGAATFGCPTSPGIPGEVTSNTILARYNDLDSIKLAFENHKGEIAALIMEPVCGNAGLIKPQAAFLKQIRELCNQNKSLLIFDEVMTGFRVAINGAQGLYQVKPDLTMLGKVIGGGLPVGAFGGKAEIMNLIAPEGPVYQAGTLSGNPLAMKAGITTLKKWLSPGHFDYVQKTTSKVAEFMQAEANKAGIPFISDSCGTMFGFFFREKPVLNFSEAQDCNQELFKKFFHLLLEQGVYIAPSSFEAGFVSLAHTGEVMDKAHLAIKFAFNGLK